MRAHALLAMGSLVAGCGVAGAFDISNDPSVAGAWSLTGDGSRSGCSTDAYNGSFEIESSEALIVEQETSLRDADTLRLVQPPALAPGGSFELTGTIEEDRVVFTTIETGSGMRIAFTFKGKLEGASVRGEFDGEGPEKCRADGSFSLTITR